MRLMRVLRVAPDALDLPQLQLVSATAIRQPRAGLKTRRWDWAFIFLSSQRVWQTILAWALLAKGVCWVRCAAASHRGRALAQDTGCHRVQKH